MEQKTDSFEAEIALLKFKEQGGETSRKIESIKRIKTYATITFFLILFFAITIFSHLNWPSLAVSKILGIGFTGWFMILFSESVGKYKGNLWLVGRIGTTITEETPASILRFVGWIFILVPIIVALLNLFNA